MSPVDIAFDAVRGDAGPRDWPAIRGSLRRLGAALPLPDLTAKVMQHLRRSLSLATTDPSGADANPVHRSRSHDPIPGSPSDTPYRSPMQNPTIRPSPIASPTERLAAIREMNRLRRLATGARHLIGFYKEHNLTDAADDTRLMMLDHLRGACRQWRMALDLTV